MLQKHEYPHTDEEALRQDVATWVRLQIFFIYSECLEFGKYLNHG